MKLTIWSASIIWFSRSLNLSIPVLYIRWPVHKKKYGQMKSNLVAVVLSAVMKNENVLTVLSFSLRGQNSRLILYTDSSYRFFFGFFFV